MTDQFVLTTATIGLFDPRRFTILPASSRVWSGASDLSQHGTPRIVPIQEYNILSFMVMILPCRGRESQSEI